MMMRRRGPGLVRMAATTAVVAGTAGAVRHHQDQKYANQAAEQQQAQYDEMQAQQAAAVPAPAPAAAPSAGDDMMAQLTQLSQLHNAGVLSDDEFAAAKAKLLA
jgi:cytosine/adenosine deaminase-related metal-dependent hydrolase